MLLRLLCLITALGPRIERLSRMSRIMEGTLLQMVAVTSMPSLLLRLILATGLWKEQLSHGTQIWSVTYLVSTLPR